MILFLDTEFNGMGGDLISMALVPERNSSCACFYEVVEHGQPVPWVAEHVIPLLDALSDAVALREAYCGTQVKQYG